jgi:ubiquinone/menaquinone biosynthesis C-methylase UbiE
MLREIKRVLKPNGEALITVFRGSEKISKKLGFLRHFRKNVWITWGTIPRYYHLFSKRELERLASKVFEKYKVRLEKEDRYENLYLEVSS